MLKMYLPARCVPAQIVSEDAFHQQIRDVKRS
jgi:hypothetical protein